MERVLCGEALAAEIRALCDKARRRIWLAVPFIGGVRTVRRLLGRAWLDRDDVDLRLLVDIEERSCLDLKSLRLLAERGTVRSLPWLHAKIYMADDTAVITSANLTEMAFSRRVEVGIKLGYDETVQLAALYDTWWRDLKDLDVSALRPIPSTHDRRHGDEHGRASPRKLWSLPDDPGGGNEHSGRELRDLKVFLDYYRKFASAYEVTQRLWPDVPLWFETDTFLNYLRHECSDQPSHKYLRRPAREFGSEQEKRREIARFARKFATDPERGPVEDWAREKVAHSKSVQKILSESRIDQITWQDVKDVVGKFNCFTSLPLNKTMFLNPENNDLRTIREAWRELLYGTGAIVERMRRCHGRLVRLGPSGIQELMGFHQPEKYPLRNSETDAGLRFLGYPIRV